MSELSDKITQVVKDAGPEGISLAELMYKVRVPVEDVREALDSIGDEVRQALHRNDKGRPTPALVWVGSTEVESDDHVDNS